MSLRWPKAADVRYWAPLAIVLVLALALRLWGIKQGLPYAYNVDEHGHFVPEAVAMFRHGLNPHYFINPPAFTYLLHVVFAVWFRGRVSVAHEFALHPGDLFLLARVVVALLGVGSVWLLYLVGVRLFGRGVGLLSSALMAVAFLPVFYSHLALNDVPTLVPLTLCLFGAAGVLRKGRLVDYLLAGIGLGLGCATKYTAGIVLLPLLAASATRYLTEPPGAWRSVIIGLGVGALAAVVSFLIANPYSVLDFQSFHSGLVHQSTVSEEAQGKLGASKQSGILYYVWSMTWGLGWLPALAALGAAVTLWRTNLRLAWLLVPAPVLYLAFMGGLQGRYFGRWLLPIFPILCLLAAFFALDLVRRVTRTKPRWRPVLIALAVLALCAQGALYSVHSALVLSRADTRNLTRAWMVAHIPPGTPIVVEPVVPDGWVRDIGHPILRDPNGDRWIKYSTLRSVISSDGKLDLNTSHVVGIEDYEKTLSPALIAYYERLGFCWVLTGTTQSGRAYTDRSAVPQAIAYYRALAQQANVAYRVSPYSQGKGPVSFSFDWTFDYYPLVYQRPGPEMTVYRLNGGRCSNG
jgi:4-amino-4-deoxy-L-arabinose transferase-like glycosyltransferase